MKNSFRQIILLDSKTNFLDSDDMIFSTQELRKSPLGKWFPFIESILENLQNLKPTGEELNYAKVDAPSEFLQGTYDFSFIKKSIEGKEIIVWSIYDYTNVYTQFAKYQQLKNEKDIYRQKLEYKNKNVQNIKELLL